ncbi:MAG TPA: 2'-5' RNA ligase family protein [Candidatus Tumulicola sp.]|jgi:hypothetical protein
MLNKNRYAILVAVVLAAMFIAPAANATAVAPSAVTAIDIGLQPDATMIQHARAANARLLQSFPKGFTLDASHLPHLTLLQRYVYAAHLSDVYAAADKVFAADNADTMQLTAVKYAGEAWGKTGLYATVIEVKPTPNLLKLQRDLLAAVAPYTASSGTSAAFYTTQAEPDINQPTLDYVAAYVPKASGANFFPHVTVGVTTATYFHKMVAEPFTSFAFQASAASVYQLGNNGTARKELKKWSFAIEGLP